MARDKIQRLLARGQELLDSGQPHEAHLVFGRVALCVPGDDAARQGLRAAEDAIAERQRRADEAVAAAAAALHGGRADEARALVERSLAAGADPERAHALLDRFPPLAPLRTRFAHPPATGPFAAADGGASAARASRRRSAFALACALAFIGLGAGVGLFWEAAMVRLAAAPVPRAAVLVTPTAGATVLSDGTLTHARRLLDEGDPAGALAVLDRVTPAEPAYPFARQLRMQAERSLPPVAR